MIQTILALSLAYLVWRGIKAGVMLHIDGRYIRSRRELDRDNHEVIDDKTK